MLSRIPPHPPKGKRGGQKSDLGKWGGGSSKAWRVGLEKSVDLLVYFPKCLILETKSCRTARQFPRVRRLFPRIPDISTHGTFPPLSLSLFLKILKRKKYIHSEGYIYKECRFHGFHIYPISVSTDFYPAHMQMCGIPRGAIYICINKLGGEWARFHGSTGFPAPTSFFSMNLTRVFTYE